MFVKLTKNAGTRLLPKNAFMRGVGLLVGGTVGAQVLTIAASPILTRLYTPEDFGLLAVFAGVLGIAVVVSSLRYDQAIPLPESEQDAACLGALSLLLVLALSLITALLVAFGGQQFANVLDMPELAHYLWILPLGLLACGVFNVFTLWSIRAKKFALIARVRLCQSIGTIAVQLLAFKAGAVALLFGQPVGQGLGGVLLGASALSRSVVKGVSWSGIQRQMWRYRHFPLFSSWAAVFNTASTQAPLILMAAVFSAGAAGSYLLAHRVILMPMRVVGTAIANVFLSNGAEAHRQGTLAAKTLFLHQALASIALPPLVIFAIEAEHLFAVVFGSNWSQAGVLAGYLMPWQYLVFTASPISSTVTILEKQKFSAIINAVMLVARVSAIFVGGQYGDFHSTVLLFSCISALLVFTYLYYVFKFLGVSFFSWFKAHILVLLCSAFIISPYLIPVESTPALFTRYLLIAIFAGVYYLLVYRRFRKIIP